MKKLLALSLTALAFGILTTPADAFVGISIGIPLYRPYPCCGPYWCGPYYRPYVYAAPAVYVARAPVVYQPAPVVVTQPAQVVSQPAAVVPSSPRSASYSEPPTASWADPNQANIDQYLQQLSSSDEQVRGNAAIELGRLRVDRAADVLGTMVTTDRSPQVRETAARALGLIGATRSLTVLQQAAQADSDREVRHSAQFAAEVIRSRLKRD
jgi:hypothetical protein